MPGTLIVCKDDPVCFQVPAQVAEFDFGPVSAKSMFHRLQIVIAIQPIKSGFTLAAAVGTLLLVAELFQRS
jgi:hypothetical protein